jgi:hypothetical protein
VTTAGLAAFAVENQSGSSKDIAPGFRIGIPLVAGGQGGGMGGQYLGPTGVVGSQAVGGGLGQGPGGESGVVSVVDASSVASGVPGRHHASNMLIRTSLYTLTKTVSLLV